MSEQQVEETKQEAPGPLDTPEVQMAAGQYAQGCKRIAGLARNMGGKGLARVMTAVAKFPYADSYPNFKKGSAEQELFTLFLSVQAVKGVIGKAVADAGLLQTIENQAVDGIVAEIQQEKEEATNG